MLLGTWFDGGDCIVPDAPPAGVLGPLLLLLLVPLLSSPLSLSDMIEFKFGVSAYTYAESVCFFFFSPTTNPTIRAIRHNMINKIMSNRFHPPLFAICLLL